MFGSGRSSWKMNSLLYKQVSFFVVLLNFGNISAKVGTEENVKRNLCFSLPLTIERLLLIEKKLPFDDDTGNITDTLYIDTTSILYSNILDGIEKIDCGSLRMKEKCGEDIVDLFIKIEINSGNSFIIQCERERCPISVVKGKSKIKPIIIYLGNIDGKLRVNTKTVEILTELYWKVREK